MGIKYFFIILLFFGSSVYAQVPQQCNGSLGDPIINITFGAGTNPGPPLAAAATGYLFFPNDCPPDGSYTLRTRTNGCFGNTWHNVPADHTGNSDGYFMLVNAALTPSSFYVDTVRGLCGGSTYEFAAWIMNVILPSACGGSATQPRLTFSIEKTDGTVLQSSSSGNIPSTPSPLWQKYPLIFTSPAGNTDIVVRIKNDAPGGCGNDLALDDITFRPCGPQLRSSITGEPTNTATVCEGTAKTFTFNCAVSPGFTAPTYQWQQRFNAGAWVDIPLENNTSLIKNFAANAVLGIYEYRLAVAEAGNLGSAQCRITSLPVTVSVSAKPIAFASYAGAACAGTTVLLNGSGGSSYSWTGPAAYTSSDATASIINIQNSQAGVYNVIVTNAAGCSAPASLNVMVNPTPTAATSSPNNSICSGESVLLNITGGNTYRWQPVTGLSSVIVQNPLASPVSDIVYHAIAINQFGCEDTVDINVKVFAKAIANAGPDRLCVSTQSVQLLGSITGNPANFFWTEPIFMDNAFALQPFAKPPADTFFVLHVLSQNGCGTSTDTVVVKVYKDIYIPNAFSPNGDAINPVWNIPSLAAYPDFEVRVFDRYGNVVFENKKILKPWDGTYKKQPLPTGAYVYFITINGGSQVYKGTVTIIR